METSLIGKALDFGSNDYGFESHVSNSLKIYHLAYISNFIKINSRRKNLNFIVYYNKRNLTFLTVLQSIGAIRKFITFTDYKTNKKFIKIFIYYYKNLPIYSYLKIISSPSQSYYVSFNSLRLLHKRTGGSIFLISTSRGVITHTYALRLRLGGRILAQITL